MPLILPALALASALAQSPEVHASTVYAATGARAMLEEGKTLENCVIEGDLEFTAPDRDFPIILRRCELHGNLLLDKAIQHKAIGIFQSRIRGNVVILRNNVRDNVEIKESEITGNLEFRRSIFRELAHIDQTQIRGRFIIERLGLRSIATFERFTAQAAEFDGVYSESFLDIDFAGVPDGQLVMKHFSSPNLLVDWKELRRALSFAPSQSMTDIRRLMGLLSQSLKRAGDKDGSGEAYYMYKEIERQEVRLADDFLHWFVVHVDWLSTGYGSAPFRVVLCCLLLILACAALYRFIPNAYSPTEHGPGWRPDLWSAIYFSIVSFTTLGYGDFRPVGVARFIAVGEAMCGWIFLSLLMATFASSFWV